ncbi:MAG: fluoride efflux transporter CrcB [Anaerovoracaceae bacterium]|jgi:CrcB protein
MEILLVGAGGAAGAVFRYLISMIPYKGTFPLLTLLTNFLGALLIGYIAGTAETRGLNSSAVLFLKTGLCGGFTTFSTFSLESYDLIKAGRGEAAVIYMILSVVLCLLGVMAGMEAARRTA